MTNKTTRMLLLAVLALLLACLPAAALAAAETGEITGNMVNLREGPGLGYKRVAYLYQGDSVTVTGKSDAWYAVKAGDQTGYVYAGYVKLKAASGSAQTGASDVLRRGSTGAAVKQLQGNLIMLGYLNSSADGMFGAKTETAVRLYQSTNGLGVDGAAGSATRSAIANEVLRILKVTDTAKQYLGLSYQSGGTSPSTGFDCSGLTQYAFAKAGVSIPRVSYEQAAAGRYVPVSKMRAGDLVAFNSPVSHVGIYLGGGKFIHSPKTGDVVKISSVSAMKLTAVRRMIGKVA